MDQQTMTPKQAVESGLPIQIVEQGAKPLKIKLAPVDPNKPMEIGDELIGTGPGGIIYTSRIKAINEKAGWLATAPVPRGKRMAASQRKQRVKKQPDPPKSVFDRWVTANYKGQRIDKLPPEFDPREQIVVRVKGLTYMIERRDIPLRFQTALGVFP